ncbi:MAG: lytic transglycosylase domain-containing protein [Thermotogaceae bacterium]|nr:lytic transglycosylase domain-containing protein [Thermotogaceae bacterium]
MKRPVFGISLLLTLPLVAFTLFCVAYSVFPLEYLPQIVNSSRKNGIDPLLTTAVIQTESGFNPLAQSPVKAFGLMQLLPETAAWIEETLPIVGSWREPHNNIELGTYYLRYLADQFREDWEIALTAYHQGPGNIQRLLDTGGWRKTNYVRKVQLYYLCFFLLYRGYFSFRSE